MEKGRCFKVVLNQITMSCRKSLSRKVVMRDLIRHLRIFVSVGMANERKEIRRSRSPRRTGEFRDDRPLFNNNNAFTLIELLVVVLIIGILAAVAVPQYQKAVLKGRYMQVLAFGNAIEKAAVAYHLANGVYPSRFDELGIDLPLEGNEGNMGKGTQKTYKDYTCQIFAGMSDRPDGIRCWLTTSNGELGVLIEYSQRVCLVSSSWTMGNKICQNMTGQTTVAWQYGSSSYLHNAYKFN